MLDINSLKTTCGGNPQLSKDRPILEQKRTFRPVPTTPRSGPREGEWKGQAPNCEVGVFWQSQEKFERVCSSVRKNARSVTKEELESVRPVPLAGYPDSADGPGGPEFESLHTRDFSWQTSDLMEASASVNASSNSSETSIRFVSRQFQPLHIRRFHVMEFGHANFLVCSDCDDRVRFDFFRINGV